jgi:type II secretory pathway pseudopilin PulG
MRAQPVRNRPTLVTYLVLLGLAVVAVWLVLVFSRTLGDVSSADARAAAVRAEVAALQQRLAQAQHEQDLVNSDAFQKLAARGYGMGLPGEQIFSLTVDGPAPTIAPLGGPSAAAPQSPLDAWLELLFGH